MGGRIGTAWLGAALLLGAAPPPEHTAPWPGLVAGTTRSEIQDSVDRGPSLERGRQARGELVEHRRLDAALGALLPQRKNVVDAYVVVAALDSDPVFAREAREAGRVLARRFDAEGRTLVLAGSDGRGAATLPGGSLHALTLALARAAELMDSQEDVLVLYTTSHGAPYGLTYHDGDEGYGILSPARLKVLLGELGIRNRLLMISACYSGVFVPLVASDTTAVVTAASDSRTSFGCQADNDWTFFGDALVNRALRTPQTLDLAAAEALRLIAQWEKAKGYKASYPQVSVGSGVGAWLKPLEARMPKTATAPVGRPSVE
ncbi:MAG TPA: C13 family peptidase [Allosphingosinicella sp.]|jgi:hypothetical protein